MARNLTETEGHTPSFYILSQPMQDHGPRQVDSAKSTQVDYHLPG